MGKNIFSGESVHFVNPIQEGYAAIDNERTTRRIVTELTGVPFHPVEVEELTTEPVTLRNGESFLMLCENPTEAIIRFALMSEYTSDSMFN